MQIWKNVEILEKFQDLMNSKALLTVLDAKNFLVSKLSDVKSRFGFILGSKGNPRLKNFWPWPQGGSRGSKPLLGFKLRLNGKMAKRNPKSFKKSKFNPIFKNLIHKIFVPWAYLIMILAFLVQMSKDKPSLTEESNKIYAILPSERF